MSLTDQQANLNLAPLPLLDNLNLNRIFLVQRVMILIYYTISILVAKYPKATNYQSKMNSTSSTC